MFGVLEIFLYYLSNMGDLFINNLSFDINFAYILNKFLLIFISLIIYGKFKGSKKKNYLSSSNLLILSSVSFLNILLVPIYIRRYHRLDSYFFLLIFVLFAINILVLYLFYQLNKLYHERVQSQDIDKRLDDLKAYRQATSLRVQRLRSLEHDLKNRLIPLQMIKEDAQMVDEYLTDILGEFRDEMMVSTSGILELDAIINSKYELSRSMGIDFDLTLSLPEDININHRDLALIMANLLDNAIEAVAYVDDKWIRVRLDYDLGILYIKIENSYDGYIVPDKIGFVSRKNEAFRGVGLKNVHMLAGKYDGVVDYKYDNNKFAVELILYED